ncbi:hypothetical protein METP2_02505 [Methanosarcinales archaeon]|uniref:hypothetical protein n=1 Tax=Candidatus Methanoperedens sp. BLZ2 TaxID=2035255 RepID=UPI000BE22164|nr:hypothetical protein [Candidatus Methanoperedens sp. BLZ2]KAB2948075.1 MAG: hypothetical protein F9K14_02150 [Candidatus Methanoperedens sp.]MBZ0173877.1 hypothetical protein [Candidatus Methanoperedens nitroreducens]CAG0989783.1 hypothetical protein METP2_02505 [Methanosarcinales archaeon]MCX9080145.1 hypothetical protein [Candidatus Methanoperedens sp.]MCX9087829.1 hypothetical protein [Candidatus Methanoperedens sp.]
MKLELIMKLPEKSKQEALAEYAQRLSELYSRSYNIDIRKLKGQIFTPEQVSRFIANHMIHFNGEKFFTAY